MRKRLSSPGGATDFTRGVSRGLPWDDRPTAEMAGTMAVNGQVFELEFGSNFATVCLERRPSDAMEFVRAESPHHSYADLVVQPSRLHKNETAANWRRNR